MWRGGIYYAASEQSVLEVDVLESGKICKRKGMSDFDKGPIVMTRRLGQSLGYFISDGVLYITDGRPCTWERDGSRMHYGKKANWPRQCDVLMRNLGSWSSCGCCLDTCHLPKHCCRPCTPLMATVFPDDSGLFQQDKAPCHTAKNVQ